MSDLPVVVALDFETSGHYGHSACAIGMARIEGGEFADQYYTLIRPPSSRVYFTHIHGLTWEDLKYAPTFNDVWDDIERFINDAEYLLAHNAAFDRGVLRNCVEYFGHAMPPQPFLDTLKGSRKAYRLRSHSLGAVCDHLGIELNHHNALSDAKGCASIFLNLLKMGIDARSLLLNTK